MDIISEGNKLLMVIYFILSTKGEKLPFVIFFVWMVEKRLISAPGACFPGGHLARPRKASNWSGNLTTLIIYLYFKIKKL
jgi:hypothetical protein